MSGARNPTTVPGLTDSVGIDEIVGAIGILTERPTPRGHERSSASALARWAGRRWPGLHFTVDEIGAAGANLVCSTDEPSSEDLLIYSHLDTSLTGIGSEDHTVTGSWSDARCGNMVRGDMISGFGLGVARGPAAAALVGFAHAASATDPSTRPRLRLVLAGGGTHENTLTEIASRSPSYCGIESHLEQYPTPAAAVVAKAGPQGILWDEPGAGYLRIRVSGSRGAVLMRDRADPPGGLPAHIGEMCAAVETWRSQLTSSSSRTEPSCGRQAGREVGIGAIRSGSTRKPDLLPAFADLYLYLVLRPGDVIEHLATDLRAGLQTAFAGGPLSGCTVAVDVASSQDAGTTSPHSAFVRSATEIWERHHGVSVPNLSDWTGSTDGALLRSLGINAIRTGPTSVMDDNDPEWDALSISELLRYARIYTEIGITWTAYEKRGI